MAAAGNLPPASGHPNKRSSSAAAAASRDVAIASGLRVGRSLHLQAARRLQHLLLRPSAYSSWQAMSHSGHFTKSNGFGRYFLMGICSTLESKANLFSSSCSSFLYFFGGKGSEKGTGDEEKFYFETAERDSSRKGNDQLCTNILIAINILLYGAEILTQGKLMLWGAKVNDLIKQGQIWRFVTSSFLHANLMHLMVNSYSLNSIGPLMEKISGPRRFLSIYLSSAIASSVLSYRFCQLPSVGASGAIFGLVGSLAVFVLRHRKFIGGGKEEIQQIARVIALNMVIGLLSRNTDNWGHLGGLLGGAAVSWFVGPAWSNECSYDNGRLVFADKAPLFRFIDRERRR